MKTALNIFGIVMLATAAVTFMGCDKKHDGRTGHEAQQTAEAAQGVVEQTMCPVMKAPINKDLFIEYQGKKVYFCCPGCEAEFKKDPEKYLPELPQFQK